MTLFTANNILYGYTRGCLRGIMGQIEEPINNSKGCGGIMRAALIALCSHMLNMQKLDMHGAKTVAITHGHILGAYLGYDRIEKNYNYVTENDR